MLRLRTLFCCIIALFLKHSVSQTTTCTQSCDCFNPKAGDVHKEDGAQSCCISSSGSGICKQTCADGDTCNLSKDRSKGGFCFTKLDTECPTDTNCGNQLDGTTSRNVDGECVKCNMGSFAADDTLTCAACTTVTGALNTATYTCTTAFDSRVSACAASSTTKKTVGSSGAADTCTAQCAAGTWDNANVCSSGSDSSSTLLSPSPNLNPGQNMPYYRSIGPRDKLRTGR